MIQGVLRQSLIGVMLLALSGCMSFRLETAEIEEGKGMAEGSTIETIHGSFWLSSPWSDYASQKCEGECCGSSQPSGNCVPISVATTVWATW